MTQLFGDTSFRSFVRMLIMEDRKVFDLIQKPCIATKLINSAIKRVKSQDYLKNVRFFQAVGEKLCPWVNKGRRDKKPCTENCHWASLLRRCHIVVKMFLFQQFQNYFRISPILFFQCSYHLIFLPTRCYYCAVPFAVIAKFETFNEDLK